VVGADGPGHTCRMVAQLTINALLGSDHRDGPREKIGSIGDLSGGVATQAHFATEKNDR
jgi:hypothetical protein